MVHGARQPVGGRALGPPEAGGGLAPLTPVAPLGVGGTGGERPVEEGDLEVDLQLVAQPGEGPRPEQGGRHPPRRVELAVTGAGLKHGRRGVDEEAHGVGPPRPGRPALVHPGVQAGADEEGRVGRHVALVVAGAEAAPLVGGEQGEQLARHVPLGDVPSLRRLRQRRPARFGEPGEGGGHRAEHELPGLPGGQVDGGGLGHPEQLVGGGVPADLRRACPVRDPGPRLGGTPGLRVGDGVPDDRARQPHPVDALGDRVGVHAVACLLLGGCGLLL